jgi:hypothetical protein
VKINEKKQYDHAPMFKNVYPKKPDQPKPRYMWLAPLYDQYVNNNYGVGVRYSRPAEDLFGK